MRWARRPRRPGARRPRTPRRRWSWNRSSVHLEEVEGLEARAALVQRLARGRSEARHLARVERPAPRALHAQRQPHGAGDGGATRRRGYAVLRQVRSEEHTSELKSLMRTSYAVFC